MLFRSLGKLYTAKDSGIKENAIKYYSKAVSLDPDRFQKINHTIADYYYDNKKMDEAKTFYQQSLSMPTSVRYWDVDRLVKIFLTEKNFPEAEKVVKQYLNPEG